MYYTTLKVRVSPLMTLAGHVKSAFRLPEGGACIYKVV
ncbi:Uncharacterized protein dnm_063160 [Desulfonema magnum]|uniref:Uncharacterized protein n=1 Tax=Desulfonema magnum TaxID=45655 RepID=A0A975GQU2_9BACT|nr:Uncharacterized protein dnm_063160 [Desulfonema magnum]